MGFVKVLLKIIFVLVLLLTGLILSVLFINSYQTSYLSLKANTGLKENSYLITNANIIPMTGDTVLREHSLLIRNGIIEEIGDSIQAESIEVIDAEGMFISPGLIDMHVHVWDRQELGLYLANGVTTIRNAWGYPLHLRIKEDIAQDHFIAPLLYTSSPKLTSPDDLGDDKVQVATPEEAKLLVSQYKGRGFDFIKTYAGIRKDVYTAILEQAEALDIPIISHPSRNIPYLDQFHPQVASIEHAEEIVQQPLNYQLDTSMLDPIIQRYVATEKSFCPTLTGYYKIVEMIENGEELLEADQTSFINPLIQQVDTKAQINRWVTEKEADDGVLARIEAQHNFHLLIVKKMNDAGVNLICGTDAGIGVTVPGYSIHEELGFYKEAGLSNYEALKTATVNPSRTHDVLSNMGTLEKGKLANLILSRQNPLEEITHLKQPEWVMVSGYKIDQHLLKEFEGKAKDRKNLIATALYYGEYWLRER